MPHASPFDATHLAPRGETSDAPVDPRATLGRRRDLASHDDTVAAPRPGEPREPLPRITLGLGARPLPAHGDEQPKPDLEATSLLGEGGMGRVFVARQRSLGRDVAVKVLHEGAPSEDAWALLREGRTAGALEHPRIVPVHALGLDANGAPVLVMKRVRGVSWATLLREPEHPSWEPLLARARGDRLAAHLEVLSAVCDALAFAHDAGVVHRDVKPDNVLVGAWGEVYLTDWGVAYTPDDRAAAAHRTAGTPAYMAPEQVDEAAGPIAPTTDVYLLGATLHEVLVGQPRHAGDTLLDVLQSVADSAPAVYPPEVPAELARLANHACARLPAARPPTAAAFRQALEDFDRHRASARLCAEARSKLEALGRATAEGAASEVDSLGAECRFGFLLAQREWPANPDAAEGLAECLSLLVSWELSQGQPVAARALLRQLVSPDPGLTQRVEAAEQAEREARRRAVADREEAHERDFSVGARRRARLTLLLTLAVAVLGVWASRLAVLTALDLVWLQLAVLSLTFALIFVFLRRVRTRVNRELAWAVGLANVAVLLHRVLAIVADADPRRTLASDQVIAAACVALMAVGFERRLFAAAAVPAVGACACAVWPEHTSPLLVASSTLTLGIGAYVVSAGKGAFAPGVGAPDQGSTRSRFADTSSNASVTPHDSSGKSPQAE
jgi:hypothetical protein